MVGLALLILAIVVLTGQPTASPSRVTATSVPSEAVNPDRLRDYQDRLRALDQRAREQVREPMTEPPSPQATRRPFPEATTTTAPSPDPLVAERRRRDYESLFASNVVMSRRPDAQVLVTAAPVRPQAVRADGDPTSPPSIDEVADAVIRATSKYTAGATPSIGSDSTTVEEQRASTSPPAVNTRTAVRPATTGPISSNGSLHRLLEGTVIETVLTNRIEGSVAAPVNCLVTSPVYSHDGQYVVIPPGSRVLGETQAVQSLGETRLAVAFTRLVFPGGSTVRLDSFMGLNDIGEAGLRDQVNRHYKSTFGASAAVGLLTGLAQFVGTRALNGGDGDRTVVIAGNVGDATAQATAQTMNRFLNRLPSVTIREGHRVKVYLTSDLELPAYDERRPAVPPLLATNR
jgi:type IV secretion system protein VirB10